MNYYNTCDVNGYLQSEFPGFDVRVWGLSHGTIIPPQYNGTQTLRDVLGTMELLRTLRAY